MHSLFYHFEISAKNEYKKKTEWGTSVSPIQILYRIPTFYSQRAIIMEIDRMINHLTEMLQDRGDDVSEFVEHADAVVRPRYYSELIILDTDKTTIFFALKKELVKELTKEFKDI